MMNSSAVILLGVIIGIWTTQRIVAFRNAVRGIKNHTGLRVLLDIPGLSIYMPRIPYVTGGKDGRWDAKWGAFERFGAGIFASVSLLPKVRVTFSIADASAIKEILSSRHRFPKPIDQYRLLRIFGDNIVASEGDDWKRYRKICGPSFSERNNKLVWDETVRIVRELVEGVWGVERREVGVEHAMEVAMPLALFTIGSAGFGRRMSWTEEFTPSSKTRLSFKDTLHYVSEGFMTKIIVPRWAVSFHKSFSQVSLAYDELKRYMYEMIEQRRTAVTKEERYDLLSSLLDANDNEVSPNGEPALTDEELLSNIYIFLIAGHETTAHTLCFAWGLLALYQDEQERAYQEIKNAIPDDRNPSYQDIASLKYIEAILNETLRLYPAAPIIPKLSAEDTTLTTTNNAGEKVTVPIPAGSIINLHLYGLHYNPNHWEDPEVFRPSRFLGDWPRDSFVPFSGGVRSCLGRRFAELEFMAATVVILRNYKISVKEDSKFAGETFEERKARVMRCKLGISLTPVRMPLVFTRRN
ncbi:cytochrome P450 [Cristinia sonorae]|uniref:Cytochrome P450 n=1 Tax=Cristinia sonorae TaxID=1940300 RepID=A0A8K0UQA5_9AGAR|nr:cytochrome P450 [Cristinia sonorae]